MTEHEQAVTGQAFRQFQYPTVPLGVSANYQNEMLRSVLDRRIAPAKEAR